MIPRKISLETKLREEYSARPPVLTERHFQVQKVSPNFGVNEMKPFGQVPMLSELSNADADQIAKLCSWRTYEDNELILDYEDDTRDVHLIISGHVRIILRTATGKEAILTEISDGEFFGEIAALDDKPRSANVTSISKCEICIMPQRVFREMLDTIPAVNKFLMQALATRCRELNARLAENYFLQAKHRLYSELLRQSKPRPGHPGQRSISPPPTQKNLALRIGTGREVVSREIANLKRLNVIDKTIGALVLCDLKQLHLLISSGWNEAN